MHPVTEQSANRMLEQMKSYISAEVLTQVDPAVRKHLQTDKDFLEIILGLEKRVRLLEAKS